MKIKKIKLNNYCQFSEYTQVFGEGIIILRGKNGKGKSNFTNAIFFALTGDSFIKNKTRSSMLSWGCEKGYVELEFECAGREYKIRRSLHSSGTVLTSDALKMTKNKEITEFVAKLIRADSDVLKLSSFMPQAGANELVFGTKSERQKAFSRLFSLLHLEAGRTTLNKVLNKIPVYPDITGVINKLTVDITALTQAIDSLGDSEAQKKWLVDNTDKYNEYIAAVSFPTVEEKQDKINEAHDRLILVISTLGSAQEELAALPEPVVIDPTLTTLSMQNTAWVDATAAMNNALELSNNLVEVAVPGVLMDSADMLELTTVISTLEDANKDIRVKLDAVKNGICTMCGSDFTLPEEEIAAWNTRLVDNNNSLAVIRESIATIKEANELFNNYVKERKTLTDNLLRATELVNSFSDDVKKFSQDNYNALLQSAAGNSELIYKRNEITARINSSTTSHSVIEQEIHSLEQLVTKPEDYSAEFVSTYQEKNTEYQDNNNKVIALTTALQMNEDQLTVRLGERKKANKADKLRSLVQNIRTIIHVDNYPRKVMKEGKQKLENLSNKYLELFNPGFTCKINNSLEFKCVFPSKDDADANDLSGGQKAMLLVSCRLAIAEMLASHVELLTFDEPGAALDKEAREGLLDAFSAIRQYLSSRHIQMLIASHDDNIEKIADDIITL